MSSQELECVLPGSAGSTRIVNYGSGFVSDIAVPVDLHVRTPDWLLAELRSLGRTEDVAVAPNGRRMALAGFSHQVIGLLEIDVDVHANGKANGNGNGNGGRSTTPALGIRSITRLCSELLISPHGVSFVDDELLLVANREGALVALRLPASVEGGDVAVESWVVVDGSSTVPLSQPGSVTVRRAGGGLCEAVVCDNDAHRVVRYVLDTKRDLAVVDSEVLIEGLRIPDGVAVSASGEWLAVSNHETHEVYIYRYDLSLGGDARQVGALSGANFPHGVSFLDDRLVVVADAGLPYVYVYAAPDGDWSGTRPPTRVVRVMGDDVFNLGRYNPREGGPKGLAVVPGAAMVAVTSEWQSLACFSVTDLQGSSDDGRTFASSTVSETDVTTRQLVLRASARLAQAERSLAGSRAEHDRIAEALAHSQADAIAEHDRIAEALAHSQAESQARLDDLAAWVVELEACRCDLIDAHAQLATSSAIAADLSLQVKLLHTSSSWRVTAPLRRIGSVVRVLRRRR